MHDKHLYDMCKNMVCSCNLVVGLMLLSIHESARLFCALGAFIGVLKGIPGLWHLKRYSWIMASLVNVCHSLCVFFFFYSTLLIPHSHGKHYVC